MKNIGQHLLEKYTANQITGEQVLAKLAEHDYCVALLNDGNGHWSLTYKGQDDVLWQNTVSAAIVNGLEDIAYNE